jgi:N-acetylglucosaminyldiphosphoundecaprenol N-acetyl-beta-D-mannosaminyltransferase
MSSLRKVNRASDVGPAPERHLAQLVERDVFGLLGIPIDAVDMDRVIDHLDAAMSSRVPFVLSTPNLNFLIQSQGDCSFRETLLASDLCAADGMPIVWLSRALGIPVKKRIPGSDIFDKLKRRQSASPVRAFFFGGAEGVVDKVARQINAECRGMRCVGSISPGHGTVEQMSSSAVLDQINSSGADLVAVFLSAKKGQEWMMHNAGALRIPLRAQLGATINFQAGTVRRAPAFLRSGGLEWLWRIKQEPYLWRRYFRDGLALIRIGSTVVLPILALRRLSRVDEGVEVRASHDGALSTLYIAGSATLPNVAPLQEAFRQVLARDTNLVVDLSGANDVDPRFFGLLIVVRKILNQAGRELRVVNPRAAIKRLFRLNGFAYLFAESN